LTARLVPVLVTASARYSFAVSSPLEPKKVPPVTVSYSSKQCHVPPILLWSFWKLLMPIFQSIVTCPSAAVYHLGRFAFVASVAWMPDQSLSDAGKPGIHETVPVGLPLEHMFPLSGALV